MSKDLVRVNLYLVGFMGTGKTTVGRQVAAKLGLRYLDSDAEIEARSGRTVADIFEQQGEPTFRRLEREFVETGHPAEGCVVACGGGLVVQPGMVELLRSKGVVVCLLASPQTILKRTSGNRNRPLLDVDDPENAIRELLEKREPFYRQAGTEVLTDFRPLGEVVAHVKRVYLRDARDYLRQNRGD